MKRSLPPPWPPRSMPSPSPWRRPTRDQEPDHDGYQGKVVHARDPGHNRRRGGHPKRDSRLSRNNASSHDTRRHRPSIRQRSRQTEDDRRGIAGPGRSAPERGAPADPRGRQAHPAHRQEPACKANPGWARSCWSPARSWYQRQIPAGRSNHTGGPAGAIPGRLRGSGSIGWSSDPGAECRIRDRSQLEQHGEVVVDGPALDYAITGDPVHEGSVALVVPGRDLEAAEGSPGPLPLPDAELDDEILFADD